MDLSSAILDDSFDSQGVSLQINKWKDDRLSRLAQCVGMEKQPESLFKSDSVDTHFDSRIDNIRSKLDHIKKSIQSESAPKHFDNLVPLAHPQGITLTTKSHETMRDIERIESLKTAIYQSNQSIEVVQPSKKPKKRQDALAQVQVLEQKLKSLQEQSKEQESKEVLKLKSKIDKMGKQMAQVKQQACKDIQVLKESYELELFQAREEIENQKRINEALQQKILKVQELFVDENTNNSNLKPVKPVSVVIQHKRKQSKTKQKK